MELKQLYYFSVCAETRSFTKAAAVLYTAQSNVSKVIRSLENELGFELFERQQYGISLTRRGALVYEQARSTLQSAQKIFEISDLGMREQLRICSNAGTSVSELFCRFYREHGSADVHYSFHTCSTNQVLQRLSDRLDQIGFVYVMDKQLPLLQSRLEKTHLFFTPLQRTRLLLYAYQHEAGENLEAISLIQGEEDEFTLHLPWDEAGKGPEYAAYQRVAVTTNSDLIMRELLSTTPLGNISGGSIDRREETQSEMGITSLCGEEFPVIFGMITRNDAPIDPLAKQFVTFIKEQMTRQ